MTVSASVVEALRAMKDLDTRTHHVGYDNGPGGGNYVYQDVVFTDELYPLIDKALSALSQAPRPAEQDAQEAVARVIVDGTGAGTLGLTDAASMDAALPLADAILALTQAAPDGWRPIETAPRDGTEFQAWWKDAWHPRARFDPEYGSFQLWGRTDYDTEGWEAFKIEGFWQHQPAPPAQGAGG